MRPLIPFIRAIRSELSDIESHPLRLSSFALMKVVLFLSITLYACPIFDDNLLVRDNHSDSCFPNSIFSFSSSPVLNLNGLAVILGDSFMIVDWVSVPYLAVRPNYSAAFLMPWE